MRYYQCDKYPIEFVVSENLDKHFEAHNHVGHYVISMIMQGVITVCLENKEWVRSKDTVFIVPPYVVHSVRQERDACLLSVCIGTDFIERTDIETAERTVRELLKDVVVQNILGREQEEKLLNALRTVYRYRDNEPKEMDAGIKILADKIISHPEQEQPIETLAADIFVSRYYLIRKFKSSIGMTPHQFRIQNRIRKSQKLLDEKKTISGIAAEMGFYDQSHFDKVFQKIVGISPSEYVRSKKQIIQGI